MRESWSEQSNIKSKHNNIPEKANPMTETALRIMPAKKVSFFEFVSEVN